MDNKVKNLINLDEASEKTNFSCNELLFKALDKQLGLYHLSLKDKREALVPCIDGILHHASVGDFIHQYKPLLNQIEYVDVQIAQPLRLNERAIKELLVSRQFNEVELYRELAPEIDDVDFWKTEREVHDWEEDLPEYATIKLEQVQVCELELAICLSVKEVPSKNVSENPSTTSLKVIALLMHHLSKSPKYASGGAPNKSQIKELLLELAVELDVNNYGLSKVDERLLKQASDYLETQKN
jgi:hypothetical protein